LYVDNLSALLALARESFLQNPVLYGTLIFVFQTLQDELGEQGLPTTRYDDVVQHMTQPLLDVIDADGAPPHQLLDKLNTLHVALFAL
jgi:hypothetical protein